MVDDVLRMRATIASEQALAEMRKIERALREVGVRGGQGFRVANVEALKLRATLKIIGEETTQTLLPGFAAIGSRAGVWGLVAAGAVAAGVAIKKASTALVEMSVQARTMGITVGQMRAMSAEAEKAGVNTQTWASSLRTFGDNMTMLKYRTGGFYEEMVKLGKIDLVHSLRAANGDLAKQTEILIAHAKEIEKARGPGEAALFLEKAGIDRSALGIEGGKLTEAARNQSKAYDELLPKAKAVHSAWIDTRDAAERSAVAAASIATSLDKMNDSGVWEKFMKLLPGAAGGALGALPGPFGPLGGAIGRGQFSPMSFGGAAQAAEGGGAGASDASRMVQRGVFDALVQFKSYTEAGSKGGGGMQNASLTTGGGSPGGTGSLGDSFRRGGASVTGDGGAGGRAGTRFRPGVGKTGTPSGGGEGGTPDMKGSEFLKAQRASRIAEIEADPVLKENVLKMLQLEEGNTAGKTGAFEALLNRSVMTGNTIKKELFSGFYGPINRGGLARPLGGKARATSEAAFEAGKAGSNVIEGRTDQGMAGDPNAAGPGRIRVPGTTGIFNYWKGSRGGRQFSHEDSRRFSEEQQARVRAERAESGPAKRIEVHGPVERDRIDGAVDNSAAGSPKVEGSVNVQIESNGTAAKASAKPEGDLFQSSTVTKNRQMTPTDAPNFNDRFGAAYGGGQ